MKTQTEIPAEELVKAMHLNMFPTTSHSPLPWSVTDPEGSKENELGIMAGEKWIASVWDDRTEAGCDEADANAAFIVRACNSHATLLEACKSMLEWMEFTIPRLHTTPSGSIERKNWGEPISKARDAIAQAEGAQ